MLAATPRRYPYPAELDCGRVLARGGRAQRLDPGLQTLDLGSNELTGPIPAELGDLSNLEWLYLAGNELTGCVPAGLRDVPLNDFWSLGLPDCG